MPKSKCCFCLLIIIAIIFIIYYLRTEESVELERDVYVVRWPQDNNLRKSIYEFKEVYNRWKKSSGNYTGVKVILYWNTMYAEKHRHMMFGTGDVFRGCPVPHCYGTPERGLFRKLEAYDAILFHGIEMSLQDLPVGRREGQRYVFFSWESPASRPITSSAFVLQPNFYNWTMSYRLDSDIRRPYGRIRDLETKEIIAPPRDPNGKVPWRDFKGVSYKVSIEELEIINGKQKMAAWFVSHCNTASMRETLVKELEKFFEVDIYGKCGELQCDKANDEECYDLLEQDYFFYFSFENTLCKDYVTEKFFLPMQRYVIPVVYGGADYLKFAPPDSYINILDFDTAADLAGFLLSLSKNPVAYASYFWWKKYYAVEDTTKSTLCDLCEKLHNDDLPKKTVANFIEYYLKDQCYLPDNVTWLQSIGYR